jgi:hypothetical protein
MMLKKYKGFSFILIAIAFLFFSCASYAATFVKSSFENSQISINSILPNPMEMGEESCLQTSSFGTHDRDFSFRHLSPNRLGRKESSYISFDYHEWLSKFSFDSYSHLLRPAYYHFLFRHNLF